MNILHPAGHILSVGYKQDTLQINKNHVHVFEVISVDVIILMNECPLYTCLMYFTILHFLILPHDSER